MLLCKRNSLSGGPTKGRAVECNGSFVVIHHQERGVRGGGFGASPVSRRRAVVADDGSVVREEGVEDGYVGVQVPTRRPELGRVASPVLHDFCNRHRQFKCGRRRQREFCTAQKGNLQFAK